VIRFKGTVNLKGRASLFQDVIAHVRPTKRSIFLGGRSMGSRAALMAYLACLEDQPVEDRLVLHSFPLVSQKPEDSSRKELLLSLPERASVLFVSGTKDAMCPLDVLDDVRAEMRAKSWVLRVEGASHGMDVKGKEATEQVGVRLGQLVGEWLLGELQEDRMNGLVYSDTEKQIVWSGWQEAKPTPPEQPAAAEEADEEEPDERPKKRRKKAAQ
jgi:hypothetical protein